MKRIMGFILLSMSALSLSSAALASACQNCGRITRIEVIDSHRSATGGAVIGAIVGGAVGNQVGNGDGRKLATVAGAVGGAYAGREIAENSEKTRYRITVLMQDGRVVNRTQDQVGRMHVGSEVRVKNGRVRPR